MVDGLPEGAEGRHDDMEQESLHRVRAVLRDYPRHAIGIVAKGTRNHEAVKAYWLQDFRALFQQSLSCLPWVQTSTSPDAFAFMRAQTPRPWSVKAYGEVCQRLRSKGAATDAIPEPTEGTCRAKPGAARGATKGRTLLGPRSLTCCRLLLLDSGGRGAAADNMQAAVGKHKCALPTPLICAFAACTCEVRQGTTKHRRVNS